MKKDVKIENPNNLDLDKISLDDLESVSGGWYETWHCDKCGQDFTVEGRVAPGLGTFYFNNHHIVCNANNK